MFSKLVCKILGHKYRVIQKFSKTTRRVCCERCKADWGMNDRVKALVEWDSDLENMYADDGFWIKEPKFVI